MNAWRTAWREQQGMSNPTEHVEDHDDEEAALKRARRLEWKADVIGEVPVYEIQVFGEGGTAA